MNPDKPEEETRHLLKTAAAALEARSSTVSWEMAPVTAERRFQFVFSELKLF